MRCWPAQSCSHSPGAHDTAAAISSTKVLTAMLKRAWRWLLRRIGWAQREEPGNKPPKDIYPLW